MLLYRNLFESGHKMPVFFPSTASVSLVGSNRVVVHVYFLVRTIYIEQGLIQHNRSANLGVIRLTGSPK